eukprot:CAMPEP_0167821094 /NCGR_PEP_ID=MMETSP0112_2-20121227/6546_1 /TAXON_ID=91324 /ORGANISM="Lotharella globosa, Strain CCCM811" /LENGTH=50 /DNA_ID=CAMNT_0007721905 /DNA_START=1112 /DNA_END=1260 /DNA_ORIENTATION=+
MSRGVGQAQTRDTLPQKHAGLAYVLVPDHDTLQRLLLHGLFDRKTRAPGG